MSLTSGSRLGPYEITGAIGAGGMGEVFRARDTKLGRDVAIKVLPAEFAKDRERVARFKREAQILASLNHPNIAGIHGLEEADGVLALAMELVDGEDLAERLKRGAIPLEESIAIAEQIAEALEEAHEHGIVHRDLKPANVKVTPDGKVKVLDFGLAKAMEGDAGTTSGSPEISHSPTMTRQGTVAGMILGTAAYMSPEQARGKKVDKRADIWSFGVLLFEMLTGNRLFTGETVSDVLAGVLRSDLDLKALPPGTPDSLHRLLERCLERDPKKRLRDIGDARLELRDAGRGSAVPAGARLTGQVSRRAFVGTSLASLGLGIGAGIWWRARRSTATGWTGVNLGGPVSGLYPKISPDGQLLAFLAMVDGLTQVAVMKPGNGNWTVLTVDRTKGLVDALAWSADGSKIYYDRRTDAPVGVYSVPALGGDSRLVIENAGLPAPLKDGTVVVVRINEERAPQLFRVWPGTNRIEPLPVGLALEDVSTDLVCALVDGSIIVRGSPLSGGDRSPGFYALSPESGSMRPILRAVVASDVESVSVRPGDGAVIVASRKGSAFHILEFPSDGSGAPRTLLTVLERPNIDVGPDGALYMSLMDRAGEVLRLESSGGEIEPLATNVFMTRGAIGLADGRALAPVRIGNSRRVLVAAAGREPTAFVETDEQTGGPLARIGRDKVALLIGDATAPDLAIAAAESGRVLKRFRIDPGIMCLDASPDGRRLYYSAEGAIHSISVDGGEPRTIGAGHSFTVDPDSGDLIAKIHETGRFSLARIPSAGGVPQRIDVKGSVLLIDEPLTAGAIRNGRLLVPVATTDSWIWFVGVLDLKTSRLERLPMNSRTDVHFVSWTADGRALVTGLGLRTSLWKFAPDSGGLST